jgi:hypothetical protein
MTRPGRGRLALAAAVVLVPLLGYPSAVLVGGAPRFPTRAECARPAGASGPVDVVFGRFDTPDAADALRDRALAVGFVGTKTLADGCGRYKVVLTGVPSIEVGREIQAEAAPVQLAPRLEQAAS